MSNVYTIIIHRQHPHAYQRNVTPRAWDPDRVAALGEACARLLHLARAFHAAMTSRRSVRAFSDRPVPREIIEACIATAGSAPSGANHQPWFFACVNSAGKKREIRDAAEAEERHRTPLLLFQGSRPRGADEADARAPGPR